MKLLSVCILTFGAVELRKRNTLPVTVKVHGGHLLLTPRGKRRSTLAARSEREFYIKEWSGEVRFQPSLDKSWTLNLFNLSDQTMLTMKKSEAEAKSRAQ